MLHMHICILRPRVFLSGADVELDLLGMKGQDVTCSCIPPLSRERVQKGPMHSGEEGNVGWSLFLERAMKTGNLVPIALPSPSAFVRPPALWINPLFYLVYRCDLADLRVGPSYSFSRSSFPRCQLNRPKRVNKGRTGWMMAACSLARGGSIWTGFVP